MTNPFKQFRNPGPKNPYSMALLLMAAVLDQRMPFGVKHVIDVDGGKSAHVATASGHEIHVFIAQNAEMPQGAAYVERVILPGGEPVNIALMDAEVLDVLMPPVIEWINAQIPAVAAPVM